MSERMREPFHMLMHRASTGYNDSWSQVDQEVLEKFGEAIVMECSKVITHGGYWNTSYGKKQATPLEIAKMIRDHFKIIDEEK